jgi:hypothetical protein
MIFSLSATNDHVAQQGWPLLEGLGLMPAG